MFHWIQWIQRQTRKHSSRMRNNHAVTSMICDREAMRPIVNIMTDTRLWKHYLSLRSMKIIVIKSAKTCHLLCKRLWYYYGNSKTYVRDRIFKLSPIDASVICQIPWNCWNQWIPVPLRGNSTILQKNQDQTDSKRKPLVCQANIVTTGQPSHRKQTESLN